MGEDRKWRYYRHRVSPAGVIEKGNPRHKHGYSRTPTYETWYTMKSRCQNPKSSGYKYYGARGIRVCARWQIFENFLADMGPRPDKKTLDRINNNGHYSPENCRWTDAKTQVYNRRNTTRMRIGNREYTTAELCALTGLSRYTMQARIQRGRRGAELLKPKVTKYLRKESHGRK